MDYDDIWSSWYRIWLERIEVMGSIFSSSHRFSLDAPIKDVQRTSGTLKSKSKSISAKSSRRVASREREKQRKSKEEERRKKEKEKKRKEEEKAKPKYDKHGDRIYRKGE